MNYIDVELRLRPNGNNLYAIELSQGGSLDGSVLEIRSASDEVMLDRRSLLALELDDEEYGSRLAACLFRSQSLRELFIEAYSLAKGGASFRLWLDLPEGDDVCLIAWERLCHPAHSKPICVYHDVLISRFRALAYADQRDLLPRPTLSVLAVVADPTDLSHFGYAPIDVRAEINHLLSGLQSADPIVEPTILATRSNSLPTFNDLQRQLLARQHHILYFACHGMIKDGRAYILLEDESGKTAFIPSSSVVDLFARLPPNNRPLLVFLASCFSAGNRQDPITALIGPQLARAGIPAVVGFQDTVSFSTVAEAVPVFFQRLFAHGQVGRALAETRNVLLSSNDRWQFSEWWKPALFLSQRIDTLWQELPGYTELRQALADHFNTYLPRSYIKPSQNELTGLALSIGRCAAFQEQRSEFLKMLRMDSEGFAHVMEELYGRNAGSVEFAQLEHVLGRIHAMARGVPWSALFKLLTLFRHIAQMNIQIDEEVRRCYHRIVDDTPVNTGGDGITMQSRVIEDLNKRSGEPPMLISFVQHIGGLPKLAGFESQIRTWLQETAVMLGADPERYNHIMAFTVPRTERNARLLVLLEQVSDQASNGYAVQIYFTPDETQPETWDRLRALESVYSVNHGSGLSATDMWYHAG